MGSFSASVTSYSFHKPVLSSLVASFKTGSDKNLENERNCVSLGFDQVDCFNRNIFLNGEKYILDSKFKTKNNSSSISYDQIFGLENKIKFNEEGKALKTAKAIAAGTEHQLTGRSKSKKKTARKRLALEVSSFEHIYNGIVENPKFYKELPGIKLNNNKFLQKIKSEKPRKLLASKPYESLRKASLPPENFKSSGHLCQDIRQLKR